MGYGSLAAVLLGAFDFTGGRLKGWNRNPEQDEFERKQYIRQNRRRPIEETIAEVGEGRGRRRQRYKEGCANFPQEYMHQDTKRGGERGSRLHTESTFQIALSKSLPFPNSLNADVSYVHTTNEEPFQTFGPASYPCQSSQKCAYTAKRDMPNCSLNAGRRS